MAPPENCDRGFPCAVLKRPNHTVLAAGQGKRGLRDEQGAVITVGDSGIDPSRDAR